MARTGDLTKRNTSYDSIIKKYLSEYPDIKSAVGIARLILDGEKLSYNEEYLAFIIRQYKLDNNLTETIVTDNLDNGEKYHVSDDVYHWSTKKLGVIKIPVELADKLFYEYSRHGLNMSQIAIRQKHNFTIQYWHSIKSTLWLYKDSNIFSPYTVENTSNDDLQALIADKMDMKFTDKNRLIEDEYDKTLRKHYKKAIKTESVKTFAIERMVDELYDMTSNQVRQRELIINKKSGPFTITDLVVPVADLHIGGLANNLRTTQDFNTEILRERLAAAAIVINRKNAENVHLMFLGDMIESFTGLNHANSWQSIENGIHGAEVIILAITLIEEFISKINNVKSVRGISGNHDRITASNKEDVKGQVAEIIFYMLDRLHGNKFMIQYDDLIISTRIDGINYIIAHGDKKVIKQDGKQAIIDYGDSTIYNLILTGHWHTRMIKEDQRTYRWMACPSIFTGNYYSESNGWSTTPGILLIYNGGNNKPIIEDISMD